MGNTEFPAVLVLSAVREDDLGRRVVAFADNQVLNSEDELNRRMGYWRGFEMLGGLPYDYTLAPADQAQEAVADIKASLGAENEKEAGDGGASPAPNHEGPAEDLNQDDTTDSTTAQADAVVLVIRYHGTGQAVIPTGPWDGATDELVEYHDYYGSHPPDRNVKVVRDWLGLQGFAPSYPEWKWLDRGAGPRRRREVYRRNSTGGSIYEERIDRNLMREAHDAAMGTRLSDAERLALYKRKALAGEGVFSTCQSCPLVQDCPAGWGACDRKAAVARERQAELDRPRSHKNPRFHQVYR